MMLSASQRTGIQTSDSGTPTLTVNYSGVLTPGLDSVMMNGVLLVFLQPGLSSEVFQVPAGLLSLTNTITINNHESSSSIFISTKTFDSGPIDTGVVAPEPGCFALVGASGLLLGILLRRAVLA